ncbi:hypothetical protein GOEFS_106_01250 [Gordonia effusa NBRC 100432]|uniref:Capsule synthesis protein CapA domain-containing protein n=1 Tax=Gordonia effusa NBRC 100432 TaxID=1077974 RepID=H0R576_9ACTN|nr:CapA family protein [Gordonia effusa]GAB20227.1 hypothetical protein GOEFS_106_01250 [Gordonia effusa NBRC 100432]
MLTGLVRTICWIYGLVTGAGYSRSIEGNAGTMGLSEKLWWAHKFFLGAVENAERGSGIEDYFAAQDMRYSLPGDFVEECSARIASAGDILTSEHIRPETTAHLWDDVDEFLRAADIAIANLETPVAPSRAVGAPPSSILSAPPLNSSPETLRIVIGAGFGFFSTANNHALDQGVVGVRETLDVLDEHDCGHVGTARTKAERDDIPVLDVGGIRVAFLSYTFSVNGRDIPPGQDYLVNYLRLNLPDADLSMVRHHVDIAHHRNADAIVACVHWSLEFESFPVQTVIDNGHRLVELGIDVILGNHPHVIQPMERYRFTDPRTGFSKDSLIVYAHGDLMSYVGAVPNSMLGNIIRFTLAKGHHGGVPVTRIKDVSWKPIYRRARFDRKGNCTDFRIHDLLAMSAHETANEASERAEIGRLVNLAIRVLPSHP